MDALTAPRNLGNVDRFRRTRSCAMARRTVRLRHPWVRCRNSVLSVLLQRTTDPKGGKERMHLDLETDDVEAEVRRLEQLGATRYDHQQLRGHDFWVLRDPWLNEFCVLKTTFADLLDQRPPWPDLMSRVT
jgi:hypothetical protein